MTAARRDGLVLALILAVAAALRFVALLLHDARHDFSESHAIVDYLWHGTCRILPEPAGSWPAGLSVIAWRLLTWPVSGFVQSAPLAGFAALGVLTAMAIAVLGTSGAAHASTAVGQSAPIWAIVALSVVSPSLGVITAGLPTDHHGWLDPILLATVAVALSLLAMPRTSAPADIPMATFPMRTSPSRPHLYQRRPLPTAPQPTASLPTALCPPGSCRPQPHQPRPALAPPMAPRVQTAAPAPPPLLPLPTAPPLPTAWPLLPPPE